jgi:hypothetical protein
MQNLSRDRNEERPNLQKKVVFRKNPVEVRSSKAIIHFADVDATWDPGCVFKHKQSGSYILAQIFGVSESRTDESRPIEIYVLDPLGNVRYLGSDLEEFKKLYRPTTARARKALRGKKEL